APIAVADQDSVTEGDSVTGDVLGNDQPGADGWHNIGNAVVGVAKGVTKTTLDDVNTVGSSIACDYGTPMLSTNDSYTNSSTTTEITGDEEDVFTYTVRDGDDDLAETTLTIKVKDVTGQPTDTLGEVKEAGIVGDGGQPDGTATGDGSQ